MSSSAETERSESGLSCAVLGTGAMGSALARALLAAGHEVTVWNRTPDRAAALVEEGATRADSVASAIGSAQIVLSCVLHTGVTSDILAADGVDQAIDGRILVECSVGDPENRIALDAWATERGAQYMTG